MRSDTVADASLPPDAFRRYDESPDTEFYRIPRLVTHIDDAAINAVTQLYREFFAPSGAILDLMSSWVSHLPPEVPYRGVVGLGMSAAELRANPRLDEHVVQDLNENPRLPFPDGSFDGCGICVSIQYLTRPVDVLADVGRVLAPGAPVVITFSNRCFPTKAVAVWQMTDDVGHGKLIAHCLSAAGCWQDIRLLDRSPQTGGDPLYAAVARRTNSQLVLPDL